MKHFIYHIHKLFLPHNRYAWWLLCFISLSSCFVYAQNDEIAQLKATIERNTQDVAHVDALTKLSEITYKTSPKEAEKYADQALQIAIGINYDEGLADALTVLGDVDAYYHNNPDRAFEHHQRAYMIYKKLYQANRLDKWKIYNFLKDHAIPSYRVLYAKNSTKKRFQRVLVSYQKLNDDYVEYLASLASETRQALDKKSSELKDKDEALASKEDEIKSKDDQIYNREKEIQKRERELRSKEKELRSSRSELREKNTAEELLQQINNELLDNLSLTDSAKKVYRDKILAQEFILERNKRKIAEQKLKIEHEQQLKERRNIIIGVGLAGFIVVIAVVIIVYRSYQKQKKAYTLVSKQKTLLEQQQKELIKQKQELEIKNAEIIQKTLEIVKQNEEIVKKNIAIQEQKEELEVQNAQIAEQYVEIEQINVEISAQRDAIETAHSELGVLYTELQEKNADVKASITYAQRIQNAFLPQNEQIKSILHNFFILFKPRDIVSGDFYWIHKLQDTVFVAAIDCTGHGVPGAFMSMLADALLSQIIVDNAVYSPEKVLLEMHLGVRKLLRQSETGNRDGMDAALVVWHQAEQTIEFAGAKNPLVLIQEIKTPLGVVQDLVEIRGDISPIGGQQKDKYDIRFKKHIIPIGNFHTFYIFSDGYQDQFGGEQGRKFMSGKFKKLITEIVTKPMNIQKAILIQKHEEWKGTYSQVDDILIIGVRLRN